MDDVVTLIQDGKEIRLAPLAIYAILKEVHELRRFQLIVRSGNQVSLRIEAATGIDEQTAFHKAKSALESFLEIQGVYTVKITLSEEKPTAQKGSGKFKHIINE